MDGPFDSDAMDGADELDAVQDLGTPSPFDEGEAGDEYDAAAAAGVDGSDESLGAEGFEGDCLEGDCFEAAVEGGDFGAWRVCFMNPLGSPMSESLR